MMKSVIQRSGLRIATLLLSLLFIFGCDSQEEVGPNSMQASLQQDLKRGTSVYYGPTTFLWGGTARTYVEVVNGKPVSIGIQLSDEALLNLPHEVQEISLKLPGQAHATGFKTIMIGWNPEGHEPDGVYTLPHFDFHLYMITLGQIMQITGGIDEGGYALQEKGVFPSNYTFGPVPFAVPHMGLHWVDLNSPEFNRLGFSKTFIYGSNKDRVTFLEPMITRAYLLDMDLNTSVTTPVPALLKHENPGYYPATYTIEYSSSFGGVYNISLSDLAWKNK